MWTLKTKSTHGTNQFGMASGKLTSFLYYKDQLMVEKSGEMGMRSLQELAKRYNEENYVPPEPTTCMVDMTLEQRRKAMIKNHGTPDLPWFGKPIKRDADGNVIRDEEEDVKNV